MSRLFAVAFKALLLIAGSLPVAALSLSPPPQSSPRLVLASPDEKPVRLQAIRIDAEVSGSQAVTSVELVFFNPNQRILEGELQFPLLDGQEVIGMALDIDGRLRDAVPVEKAHGQQAFEDIIRQKIDPALLSKTQGNNFKLRVYPLPPNGTRRVVIRYSETLPVRNGQRLYRLPLNYAGSLDALAMHLSVRGPARAPMLNAPLGPVTLQRKGADYSASVERKHFSAKGWLELRVPAPARPEVRTQAHDDSTYFVAEVPAAHAKRARKLPEVVGLLWDSSGSSATRERGREFALLDAYFKRMNDGEVRLIRLRDVAEPPERFPIRNGDWQSLRQALETTPADGASRLDGFALQDDIGEYLLFSDGLENYGEGRFPATGVPVHAINAAAKNDASRLRHIAQGSGGRFIDLLARSPAEAARALLAEGSGLQQLRGEGVSDLLAASPYPVNGRLLIAGRLDDARGRVSFQLNGRKYALPVSAGSGKDGLAAATWGRLKVAQLEGEYRLHRAEILRLGKRFRLVTRETSLIVLERAEDYARHDIEAPPELKTEVENLRQHIARRSNGTNTHQQLQGIVRRFEEKKAWWAKDFPKGELPPPEPQPERSSVRPALAPAPSAPISSDWERRQPLPAMAARNGLADVGRPIPRAPNQAIGGQLAAGNPDSPSGLRLRQAAPEELYRVYLDERTDHATSAVFYVDAANVFFERGQHELGLRVLSNLAEMDLENRHILRLLAYHLLQAKAVKEAIHVLQRVTELAPNEPQSWRDLGLAYAAAGERQKAIDHLLEVMIRPLNDRFPDIEMIALAELNAIVATTDTPLDTRRIDPRLLVNLPLDLRVVLSWDTDDTNVDLSVTDPNGQRPSWGNRLSYQGGRFSANVTGGYGPEEYSLKQAKQGKYKIEAVFVSDRRQILAGATTVQARVTMGFGTPQAKEETVTLRLNKPYSTTFVGEFEVK